MRLAFLGLLLSATLVFLTSAPPPKPPREFERPIVPRANVLRTMFASQVALVSDYYWIKAIQALGRARNAVEYLDLAPYAELTTDLDPRFYYVYRFAGVALPYNNGREEWVNYEESSRMLRKGIAQFPHDFQLRFVLAYNLMYFHRDYKAAGRLLADLSKEPDSPAFVARLATRVLAQGGDFETSAALARELGAGSSDSETQQFFARRAKEIALEQVLRQIDAAAERYRTREGAAPTSVGQLLASGDLSAPPVDPLGGSFFFDARGRATSTSIERRLKLYQPREVEEDDDR